MPLAPFVFDKQTITSGLSCDFTFQNFRGHTQTDTNLMAERPPPLNRNLLTLALWLLILSVFSQPAVSTESEGEITFDEISSTPSHLNYNQLALLAEQESAQAKSDQAKWDADIKAGSYFLQGGRLSKARILGLDCLTRATQMKDAQRECRAMLLLGGSFRSKGNEGKAQMYFQKALEKSELGGNTADLICALNDVAVGYVKSDSFELAIPLYQRALALARTRDEAWQEIAITNNLANIYRRNGNRDKALEVFNEALQRSEKSGHLAVQSVLHRNIGALFLSRRELSECLDHLQRSVSLSR